MKYERGFQYEECTESTRLFLIKRAPVKRNVHFLVHGADQVYDEVTDLPGVTFQVNFKHYAGYLDASLGNHLHYW